MAVLDPREKTQQEALEAQRANTAAKEAAKEAEAAKAKEAEAAKKEGSGSTPAETEQEGPYYIYKKPAETSTYPVSFAKNLMGGNVDVISQLNEIKFEQYDGSLKNAIAYIVPWKRDGVSSKTQAQNAAPNLSSLPENLWTISDDLGTSFSEAPPFDYDSILQDTSGLGTIPTDVPAFDPNAGQWYEAPSIPAPDYNQAYTDTKGSTPPASEQESAADKQKSLGSEIPVGVKQGILTGSQLLAGELLQNNPEAAQYTETALNLAGSQLGAPSGPIYIGNEDGTLNQVISGATSLATTFGMNVPTGLTTTVKPDTQPKTPKDSGLTGASVAAVADGAWQFLFNPQELSLTAGPDFASAEAWGVMDGNNSGQPLHFTKMKNPELKFSRVLLNGYVFGRQVESLEQGLFKLFSEIGGADNGVQTGPQVLEFIWGKKTFGPCVIKDVQVTEKMWDDGLLVNAEVSFTLVKVPEWTVNDGQVSVYAPGTIDPITAPTGGDLGIGSTAASNPSSPDTTEPASPEPSPSSNGGLSAEEQALYRKCQDAQKYAEEFGKIQEKIRPTGNIFSGNFTTSKDDLRNAVRTYTSLYNKMAGIYGRDFTGKITNPTANPSQLSKQVEAVLGQYSNLPANRQTSELSQAATYVYSAADSGRVAMKAITNSSECKAVRDKADKITAEGNKARAEQERCDALRAGSSCSPIGSVSYTCGGTKILCDRDGRWKNYNAV